MVKFLPLRQVQSFSLGISLFSLVAILAIKIQTAARSTAWLNCACRTSCAFFIRRLLLSQCDSNFFLCSLFLLDLWSLIFHTGASIFLSHSAHVHMPQLLTLLSHHHFQKLPAHPLSFSPAIAIIGFKQQLAAFSSA